MKNLITCLVVYALSCTALAELWTVDDDGKADFDNIQAAIDAASTGDRIIVMPGTYTSTADEVVDMRGKKIWLHSSAGAGVTIIDGEGTRRGIYCGNGENSNTIIEGFTITKCYSTVGGGMYNSASSPTLTNCTFTNNTADSRGGGMYNYNNSSPTLTNCTFTNNTADSRGGGMYNSSSSHPTLDNCTFTDNVASDGGGMHNYYSSPTLTNCTFTDNGASGGGGMYNNNNSSPTLTNCTFENNGASDEGGGIKNSDNSSPSLTDCIITGNYACVGGGMWNWNKSNPTLTNNSICENSHDQIFGDYSDDGGNSIAETCPWNQGTCCTNNNCLVSDQEDCNAFFGQWLGEGTTCESNPCPIYCPGDLDGDGEVKVADLLLLIAAWGTCP